MKKTYFKLAENTAKQKQLRHTKRAIVLTSPKTFSSYQKLACIRFSNTQFSAFFILYPKFSQC